MTADKNLISDARRVLSQGRALLGEITVELFAKPEPSVSSSGIGSHFRHVIEYFDLFLAGAPGGRVDYDQRLRDVRIETEVDYAVLRLAAVERALEQFARQQAPADGALRSKADAIADVDAPWTHSSVDRELQFLCSHAVHHYALIAVILRLNGEEPPADFGVAPSTLRHWRESGSCAR